MTDLQLLRPEDCWPVEAGYEEAYAAAVADGRAIAAELDAVIVGIARNAMPMLGNTLMLAAEMASGFRSSAMFVYENDSADGTDTLLQHVAASHQWFHAEHATLGGIDSRGFERERTERLAACRNRCLEWVRENGSHTTWTIVLDLDPARGFSVDGVFNSIAHLANKQMAYAGLRPGGMASYSLYRNDGGIAHYDAWAARPVSWWDDRREKIGFQWFSGFLPPVGAPPCPMNSAFGGLCVYDTRAFLAGGYSGEDCEHVPHHKRMRQAGYQMWLNPGARYIAVWDE